MSLNIEYIRAQFPILAEKVYGHDLVYLDNAATTQKPLQVIEASLMMQRQVNGNIHRGIHFMAEKSTELYEEARNTVMEFIGAGSRTEIVFTGGATASLNLVAYCFSEKYVTAGDNVVVTEMEHHSNIVPWQLQTARKQASLRYIPITDDGALDLSSLDSIIDGRTKIVSVTATSNVLGTNNDIAMLSDYCHRRGIPILVDGSQAVQHCRVDVKNPDVDFYVFSGHKIFAPTGIGVLYAKEKWLEAMPPFMCGGDMISTVTMKESTWAELPLKYEAGTSNYMGAVALGEAIRWYSSFDMNEVNAYLSRLTDRFTSLLSEVEGIRIYGTREGKAPIVSFNIDGCHPMDIAQIVDRQGVALRSGTQCAQPLMDHYGVDAVARISMALYNTEEEIDRAAASIAKATGMLRR